MEQKTYLKATDTLDNGPPTSKVLTITLFGKTEQNISGIEHSAGLTAGLTANPL